MSTTRDFSKTLSAINWSAVGTGITAAYAVIQASSATGIDWNNRAHLLHVAWTAILAFAAAYKGTAKGSVAIKKRRSNDANI